MSENLDSIVRKKAEDWLSGSYDETTKKREK